MTDRRMTEKFGLFRNARFYFAVPLERLLQVLHQHPIYPLPDLPVDFCGVLVESSRAIPVLDPARLFAGRCELIEGSEYQVLLATEFGPLAIPADETVGIVGEARGETSSATEDELPCLIKVFHYQKNSFRILDVDALIMKLA